MIVVLANDLPPAVRGRMKLWFIEPRPNVFVSGIRDSNAKEVVDYLYEHCPPSSGLMIFWETPHAPGYDISWQGQPTKKIVFHLGPKLVVETLK